MQVLFRLPVKPPLDYDIDDMTTYLSNVHVLPGLQMGDLQKIRAAFDCLLNYYENKGLKDNFSHQRPQSIAMLIFFEDEQ